jgi:hypothetical protein
MTTPEALNEKMERLEALLADVEARSDEPSLGKVRALVRVLMEVHAHGLEELLTELRNNAGGAESIAKAARNPAVRSLLLMHDLHPESLRDRSSVALRGAHEVAGAHARAHLVRIDGERVVIRIRGETRNAEIALRNAVERLFGEHAPDAVLDLEGGELVAPGFVPIERLRTRAGATE